MSVKLALASHVLEPAASWTMKALVPVLGVPFGGRSVLIARSARGRAPRAPVQALLRGKAPEGRTRARLAAIAYPMGVIGRVLEAPFLARSSAG